MNKQEALFTYLLRLGDTGLILSQRLSEWTSKGPFLEEDLALTNIALDIMGRSKSILEYAAKTEGRGKNEDDLAFFRNEREFFNLLLTEQPNGDYANTMVKQCIIDQYDLLVYTHLARCPDVTLAGIATKAVKEIMYHVRHSSKWLERFGKGTEESHVRVQKAINELWRFTGDLFESDEVDQFMLKEGIAPNLADCKNTWTKNITAIMETATLKIPADVFMLSGSRKAMHTEHLGFILAEMQHLPRMHPTAKW